MITLLEKKDKDRRFIKNWRPISLINVDVKIASKAFARRLEPILPELIHHNQNGFIKGRSTFDAVRTIDDLLELAKLTNTTGILMAIDFEKAFDSLDHTYLFKVLEKFNFGPYFLQWVKTFYTNISSCILNNGFTTDLFCIHRGVRQGDPLSPLLFILALEVLACQIRQDKTIQGIMVKNVEIKLTLFADDMTCFLKDINAYSRLCTTLKVFSLHSGLRINDDKTEVFGIGPHKLVQNDFTHKVRKSIKILGTVFDYHKPSRDKANFDSIFKSIKKTLSMWKWRGLTLIGKIQIVKTFIIPKFLSKATAISISNDLVKEINRLIFGFIWKGNDKIKRTALINDIENGGLKMLDIESMISAQRVMILKKYLGESNSTWKTILDDFFFGNIGGKLILFCDFETSKLPVHLPIFYKECLEAFRNLKKSKVATYEDVVDQIIWNNRNIVIHGKSLFEKHLFTKGIVKIGDLLSDTGKFLESPKVLEANLSPIQYFKLIGIVDAIPKEWRLIIKESHIQHQQLYPQQHLDTVYIYIDETKSDLLKASSKLLYKGFKTKKQTPPTAKRKLKDKYPEVIEDWKKIYSLPFTVTLETKIREFQYKLLNDIIFTNERLFRFKMIESPMCTFCLKEVESLEHLLFYCDTTKDFWRAFSSWLSNQNVSLDTLTFENILFGVFNNNEDFIILNHLILLGKFFIYKCKLNKIKPTLTIFLAKTKTVYYIEKKIATKNNQLYKHYKKWEKLMPSLNNS